MSMAVSMFSMTMLSVISSFRFEALSPASRSADATWSMRSVCENWRLERLTLIVTCVGGEPLLLPRAHLPARLVQHPLPERHDEAGLLGDAG